ncbi:MAG TPA: hypothetical protein VFQ00_01460 [Terriglobales bacterium]|nr:hypothetical protein [Terriglobales bacterium]
MDLRRAAVSLREAAAQKGIPVKIKTGSPGQLEILRDGVKLFDYKQSGALPDTERLLGLIVANP